MVGWADAEKLLESDCEQDLAEYSELDPFWMPIPMLDS